MNVHQMFYFLSREVFSLYEKLDFEKAYEKRTYSVEFTVSDKDVIGTRYSEGSVSWVSSNMSVKVRSSVLIAFQ